jgi:hypothetical protein
MSFQYQPQGRDPVYKFPNGSILREGDIVTIEELRAGQTGMGSERIKCNVELFYCGLASKYSNGHAFLLCGTPELGTFGVESTSVLSITRNKKGKRGKVIKF